MKLSSIADIFSFRKTAVTSSGEVVDKGGAKVGLFEEVAVSQLLYMLTRVPDLDEVLKQAGIKRTHLRVLTYDDEIAQSCETRLDALLGVHVRFEPSDTPNSLALWEIIAPVLSEAVSGAFQARLYGYSVLEAVYHRRLDGLIGLSFLGEKPFEWFEPKTDGRLMFFPAGGYYDPAGIEVDQTFKFFLTRARPTYRMPYGDALLSKLYWPWFFRQNGWKFWAKFLERFGAPLLVGRSTNPAAMVTALLTAHSQAVIGVDTNDSVEAVGSGSSNNGSAFDAFETAVIRRIQKVVLGQTLSSGTDGGSGNRALGQVHEGVRNDKRNSDINLVQPTLQRIIDALCILNGFDKHVVVFADEVGLEGDRAKRDVDLYSLGVRFKDSYFEDNYDLSGEDFTIVAPIAGTSPPTATPPSGDDVKNGLPVADDTTSNSSKGAKASQSSPRYFSKDGKPRLFTPAQQTIEKVADMGLAAAGLPISTDKLRSAVLKATNPEDLEERLFALLGDNISEEQFTEVLEAALYSADVIGYVTSEGNVS